MSSRLGSLGFPVLAGGYLPAAAPAGPSQTVNGCSATSNGSGVWTVIPTGFDADDPDLVFIYSLAGAGGKVFPQLSAYFSPGQIGWILETLDNQVVPDNIDLPYWFVIFKRPNKS